MIRLLHDQHAFSDRFIAHMLARNGRLEQDLVDQLFNYSERRLARTLLLLARYGKPDGPRPVLPPISQEVLAEMVGTTRSRVNAFMNKFRKLGFIEYNQGGLKVHRALLTAVLHDTPASKLRALASLARSHRTLRDKSEVQSPSSHRKPYEVEPKENSRCHSSAA
jgi:CRP/FNR family transcriptional regulator, cyclic AMP receptor protein